MDIFAAVRDASGDVYYELWPRDHECITEVLAAVDENLAREYRIAHRESEGGDEAKPLQSLIDRVVGNVHVLQHSARWPEFAAFTKWCEEVNAPMKYMETIWVDEVAFLAVPMSSLRHRLTDDSVRDAFGLDDDARITNRKRLAHLRDVVERGLDLENDQVRICLTLPVDSSKGRLAEVGFGYWGAGPGPGETEWFGVYRNFADFHAALIAKGFATSRQDLDAEGNRLLRFWDWRG